MMTSERPRVTSDGRYPVMKTCALLGITRATLARYRKAGRITATYRETDHRVVFEGREILRCWMNKL